MEFIVTVNHVKIVLKIFVYYFTIGAGGSSVDHFARGEKKIFICLSIRCYEISECKN